MLESLEIPRDFEAFSLPETGKIADIKFPALSRFIPEIADKKWLNRTAIVKPPSQNTKLWRNWRRKSGRRYKGACLAETGRVWYD